MNLYDLLLTVNHLHTVSHFCQSEGISLCLKRKSGGLADKVYSPRFDGVEINLWATSQGGNLAYFVTGRCGFGLNSETQKNIFFRVGAFVMMRFFIQTLVEKP